MTLLAINLFKGDGSLEFPASRIFDVDGVRVGVIGAARPRDVNSLTLEETGRAVARESARLEQMTDLIVVLAHMGTRDCELISRMAPQVDVFVGGHTHTAVQSPVTVEGTGALIVQAGSSADYVGRLELTVDTEREKILEYTSELVEMRHGTVPLDDQLLERIQSQEEELVPEADIVIGTLSDVLSNRDMGIIGAEALRRAAGVEIGFCHAGQVIRGALGPGTFDVNAIFRTGGQRGYDVVSGWMTGRQIETYLNGLANRSWGQTMWSGFEARTVENGDRRSVVTNLEADRTYSFVMPGLEWRTRLVRLWEELENEGHRAKAKPVSEPVDMHFTEAVVAYFGALDEQGTQLERAAEILLEGAELPGH